MKEILIEHIKFGYNKQNLLFKDFSVSFNNNNKTGYVYALMGASGSGKSSLIKLILGIENIESGSIQTRPSSPIISYIPQEPILFEHLSPLQNASFFEKLRNYYKVYDSSRFSHLTELLGLKNILKTKDSIDELSGGEKQRLAILRALSIKSDILILDEPLIGLDAENKNEILIIIREIVKEYNLLAIYITHHFSETKIIADEVLYISKNKEGVIDKVYKKETKDFFKYPPNLESAYSIHFPSFNTLKIMLSGKRIIPNDTNAYNDIENYYLTFDSDCISFDSKNGFKIKDIVDANIYLFVRLFDFNTTLKSNKKITNSNSSMYLLLNGHALLYDNNKELIKSVTINNNNIKENI